MSRTLRIYLFGLFLIPFTLSAQGTGTSTEDTLKQLILLVSQYEDRIKSLESENALLKNEVMKAGIQIKLEDYSGTVVTTKPVTSIPTTYLTGILSPAVVSTGTLVSYTGTQSQWIAQYGSDVGGFMTRIQKEWKDIRNAYKLPENAVIGGYEFVQTQAQDHVFVDIVFGTGTTGIYDAKILYQYDKKEFKRKLIGFFEYSSSTTRYTTRSGTNPFAGISRTFVKDPLFIGTLTTPSTATLLSSSSSGVNVSKEPSVSNPVTSVTTSSTPVVLSDIEKAYSEKRYLSVISLSNTYLATNTPTYDLLRIRYRTYFIIGKYSESLNEIAKIQSLGKLDKQTACDAQVIATYGKDTSLVTKYSTICSGK